jgi:transcription elongation factor/antiterminator RfaH
LRRPLSATHSLGGYPGSLSLPFFIHTIFAISLRPPVGTYSRLAKLRFLLIIYPVSQIIVVMKRWYVVNTKPRNEDRAATNLANGGIEVLSPRLKLRKYKEGKFAQVVEPMFPGYIFVRFHPVDEFRMVKYARGVKTIVNFGGQIVPVQDEMIEFIKTRLDDGVAAIPKQSIGKGEKILIKDGPFKGLSGIFESELDGRERVAILLDGVNYCAKMEIDRDLIVIT